MRIKHIIFAAMVLMPLSQSRAAAIPTRPVVLELFTSQGCSSCPPAEVLLSQLAKTPDVLALSLHVQYWDYLGWRDPFATPENTNRQRAYNQTLRAGLYTPQLVIDGNSEAVGSSTDQVTTAINFARTSQPNVPIVISESAPGKLRISVQAAPADAGVTLPLLASVWVMQYKKHGSTDVLAGENRGRTLESLHSVIRITKLGLWHRQKAEYDLPIGELGDDGIAVLLQSEELGRIIGATTYNN